MPTLEDILKDAQDVVSGIKTTTDERKHYGEASGIESLGWVWVAVMVAGAAIWKYFGWSTDTTGLSPWLLKVKDWITPIYNRLRSFFTPIWNALNKAITWVDTTLHRILDPIRNWFDKNLLPLVRLIEDTSKMTTNFIDWFYTKVFGPLQDTWGEVHALTDDIAYILGIVLPDLAKDMRNWADSIQKNVFDHIYKIREEMILAIKSTEYNLTSRITWVKDTLDYNFALITKWKDTLDVYVDAAFVAPGKLSREAAVWQADQYGVEQDWKKWEKALFAPSIESQQKAREEQELTWLDKKIIEFVDPASPEQKEIDLIVAQTTADLWIVKALGGAERTF